MSSTQHRWVVYLHKSLTSFQETEGFAVAEHIHTPHTHTHTHTHSYTHLGSSNGENVCKIFE